MSIQVYRSSFPIVKWNLNDDDFSLTKAAWAGKPADDALPQRGTPGQAIEWTVPSGYAEPTRAGFEFAGWSTDKSAPAGGFIDGTEPRLSMPDGAPAGGEYTLYALWTPNEYSVVFDLAKNPEVGEGPGSDASFALNWATTDGVRTVTDLGGGRYRVDGFTMRESDYDATTRTVGLPEPSRTGYRFLGWAEPDGQALAIDNAAKDGYAMNPVRLTQIDGTPVLTARWASAFGVTAPLSVTFGDYDKTGAPGNPSMGSSSSSAADDTTQSEADDVETAGLTDQQRYEAAGSAYFENTGWNDAIKMVAVTSERDADANQVLTTYDSSKATEAAVLGDGTAANPGERLLSLYPASSAPADRSTGIHFRLSDSLAEADLAQLPSIAAKAKQPVTYGLNLSTDPVTGAANHGLVLETEDYEPKQIATVSYTFAAADAVNASPIPLVRPTGSTADALYITVDSAFIVGNGLSEKALAGTYGLADVKAAAADLSANAPDPGQSAYWPLYKALLDKQVVNGSSLGEGPYFQLKVDEAYLPLQLIGICQDTKTAGGKAGLSFQMRDVYASGNTRSVDAGSGEFNYTYMNPSQSNSGSWGSSAMRSTLHSTFWGYLPTEVRAAIVPVDKFQQLCSSETDPSTGTTLQKTTGETVWLPSMYEMFGASFPNYNGSEALMSVSGYVPFQYMAYQGNAGSATNARVYKAYNGVNNSWWTRSAYQGATIYFARVASGSLSYAYSYANVTTGVVPCFCL